MENNIKCEMEVPLTPELMARAFWNMSADEQADFFKELDSLIRSGDDWYNAEVQWHYLADELKKEEYSEGRSVLMAIAAPLYLHSIRQANLYV